MKITDRLLGLVSFIDSPCSVADIGTDHAYLTIYLAQNFTCDKLIASEVKLGPYQTAINNVREFDLEDEIEIRLGSGLSVLHPEEVNTVVIAGMGGNTISEILTKNQKITDSIVRFILQPMSSIPFLRNWLVKNQFKIAEEGLVKTNNKFYEIIVAEIGEEIITDEFLLEIGPRLKEKQPKYYREFLVDKKNRWQKILNNLPQNEAKEIINKRSDLKKKLAKVQEVIKCL